MEVRVVILESLKIIAVSILFRFFFIVHAEKGLLVTLPLEGWIPPPLFSTERKNANEPIISKRVSCWLVCLFQFGTEKGGAEAVKEITLYSFIIFQPGPLYASFQTWLFFVKVGGHLNTSLFNKIYILLFLGTACAEVSLAGQRRHAKCVNIRDSTLYASEKSAHNKCVKTHLWATGCAKLKSSDALIYGCWVNIFLIQICFSAPVLARLGHVRRGMNQVKRC